MPVNRSLSEDRGESAKVTLEHPRQRGGQDNDGERKPSKHPRPAKEFRQES
jgi:hypothetical protein